MSSLPQRRESPRRRVDQPVRWRLETVGILLVACPFFFSGSLGWLVLSLSIGFDWAKTGKFGG